MGIVACDCGFSARTVNFDVKAVGVDAIVIRDIFQSGPDRTSQPSRRLPIAGWPC